jgi:hypothetical protein
LVGEIAPAVLGLFLVGFGIITLGNAFGLGYTSPFISQGIIVAGIVTIVNGFLRPVSQVFIKAINKFIK